MGKVVSFFLGDPADKWQIAGSITRQLLVNNQHTVQLLDAIEKEKSEGGTPIIKIDGKSYKLSRAKYDTNV